MRREQSSAFNPGALDSTLQIADMGSLLGIGIGALTLTLATGILLGWFFQNELLISLSSPFAPMQFDTAVGFFIAGLGVILTGRELFNLGKACSHGSHGDGLAGTG